MLLHLCYPEKKSGAQAIVQSIIIYISYSIASPVLLRPPFEYSALKSVNIC
jgi:hypothetical protein